LPCSLSSPSNAVPLSCPALQRENLALNRQLCQFAARDAPVLLNCIFFEFPISLTDPNALANELKQKCQLEIASSHHTSLRAWLAQAKTEAPTRSVHSLDPMVHSVELGHDPSERTVKSHKSECSFFSCLVLA
jgi:hypothetical protein